MKVVLNTFGLLLYGRRTRRDLPSVSCLCASAPSEPSLLTSLNVLASAEGRPATGSA